FRAALKTSPGNWRTGSSLRATRTAGSAHAAATESLRVAPARGRALPTPRKTATRVPHGTPGPASAHAMSWRTPGPGRGRGQLPTPCDAAESRLPHQAAAGRERTAGCRYRIVQPEGWLPTSLEVKSTSSAPIHIHTLVLFVHTRSPNPSPLKSPNAASW